MRRFCIALLLVAMAAIGGCGGSSQPCCSPSAAISVSPENSTYVVGPNRISIALLDSQRNPVAATGVVMQVRSATGVSIGRRTLTDIGAEYGGIHTYIGTVTFPDIGQYQLTVTASTQGHAVQGDAYVTVMQHSAQIAVGQRVPLVRQAVLGDPGVTLAMIDSGVPPDAWHTTTIAGGVAAHRPMVLFFGDPAYCPSKTCGPTRDILEQLCATYCSSLLFEHIETYLPAGPPGPSAKVNPAFNSFGLQTDPWVYFVTAQGIVSDRYEGPVTLAELVQSAKGTLAGDVPAVPLS